MDLAGDLSYRSDSPCEGSREDHHASFATCTLTFPISPRNSIGEGDIEACQSLAWRSRACSPRDVAIDESSNRFADTRMRERKRKRERERERESFLLIFLRFGICL